MKILSKVIYVSTLSIGAGLIIFEHGLMGIGVMIIGGIVTILTDPEISGADYYSSPRTTTSKKPYYKNEYEEYQHYKHCKRKLRK